ncbi:hypothetical protein MTR_5g026535 [Medicago truncatula]|uniref:Uncharacterized protein n=1 Tax=Medicago truncatula TaxID=3880 RepID=A0A072UDY5_MEDTR|nr:hypothetical protein MTR_5g026535 [Medicago truncatula]
MAERSYYACDETKPKLDIFIVVAAMLWSLISLKESCISGVDHFQLVTGLG